MESGYFHSILFLLSIHQKSGLILTKNAFNSLIPHEFPSLSDFDGFPLFVQMCTTDPLAAWPHLISWFSNTWQALDFWHYMGNRVLICLFCPTLSLSASYLSNQTILLPVEPAMGTKFLNFYNLIQFLIWKGLVLCLILAFPLL